ncbi:hypothetical protein BGZ88_010896 [Linnemannia elongata]|nr:hypothetical protein BGZ88_010896 [Linnemannia elongata]
MDDHTHATRPTETTLTSLATHLYTISNSHSQERSGRDPTLKSKTKLSKAAAPTDPLTKQRLRQPKSHNNLPLFKT